jgi:predicted lipoprotein
MSAKRQKRTLLPLDVWQLAGSIEQRLRSANQNKDSLDDKVIRTLPQLRLRRRLDFQRVKIDSFDLVERAIGTHLFENTVEGLA